MKLYRLFPLILALTYPSFSQTDTIYFDPISKNYIVRYIGVIYDDNEGTYKDTLITFEFEPSTKIDPIIECFVTKDQVGRFWYCYKITNGINAKQNLNEFSLHFGEGIFIESRTPITSWDNVRPRNFLPDTGFANRWVWRGHQGLETTWFIDSCTIISDGVPSIMNSYSQAKHRISIWPADQKDNSNINISAELLNLETYPRNNVLRKTVGPKLPPSPFSAIKFLDTLLSYTRQSVQLGWLMSEKDHDCDDDEKPEYGISKNIEKRILKAQKELSKGDTIKARWELEKLLKKVERIFHSRGDVHKEQLEQHKRDSDIKMTSEAYALLKYNTEYLLDQLPEKRKK